ncbi:hypothetical protein EZV62_013463 [Acer yangbiense]|uniref:Retrovirus-related Pol polyprotein from transposon TNT 1-94-like beta-barrel domain-containing protein n=1 Tax=Acer yangbiense TaxID=1000413 RepID=A0A5C7HYS1_9ROSI|nr:hypothetical protein EZV62_013463 [Acer yangbiense]
MSADMAAGSNVGLHVPQFYGENYQIWTVKMKSYLKVFGLWEYVAEDKQVPPLRANPTIAQIKQHEDEKMKKDKAMTCLHSALSDLIFTSIMHLETSKSIWDELKNRFEGSVRVKSVKLLTLKREFENLKMKDSETVKDYSSKLSELVNQMRLYGDVVEDYKVVEMMLVSLPNKFEVKVAAIEESCDLRALAVSEMVSKLDKHLFMMSQACMVASTKIWYVDSGCTSHMARDEGMFTTLDRNATTTVKLGNSDSVKAAGKGKVLIQTKSGPKIIDNVLYISDLAQNLLSVVQLLKRGYSLVFEGNLCIILDSKKFEIVRVRMHNNGFPIDFNQVKQNFSMSKHDMVRDMQAISHTYDLCDACQLGDVHKIEGLCKSCQIGKLHRKSNMNEVLDEDSSNEYVMDNGTVAESDS